MARSFTKSVPDMSDAKVPPGTMIFLNIAGDDQVLAAVAAYEAYAAYVVLLGQAAADAEIAAYAADAAAWTAANPGEEPPPQKAPFAAVVDPGAITMPERVFVKYRLRVESEAAPGVFEDENDDWHQWASTNFPSANTGAFNLAAKNGYDDVRARRGLTPTP